MRSYWAGAILLLFLAQAGLGDVVYLTDGTTQRGTVTRKDGKVYVKDGVGTKAYDESQVIHIQVESESTAPTSAPTAPTVGTGPVLPSSAADMGQCALPESRAFLYMRDLLALPAGGLSVQTREQLKRWQIAAHDRTRRVGSTMLSPGDFARRRQAFQQHLDDAERLLRDGYRRGKEDEATPEQKRARTSGLNTLPRAAGSWADPALRAFLLGIAEYHREQFGTADSHFRTAIEAQPRIAAFHQGRAMALIALDRALDALEPAMMAARLAPDAREAPLLLQEALNKTPGTRMDTPVFQRAKAMLETYNLGRLSKRTFEARTRWLAPGREWSAQEDSLPVPTVDRYVVRQGVGIPVTENALLVGSWVVANALTVQVQLDDGNTVVCRPARPGFTMAGAGDLVLLTVPGAKFTPVSVFQTNRYARPTDDAPTPPFAADQSATAFAADAYEEMSREIRRLSARITSVQPDGTAGVETTLPPGCSAGFILTEDNQLVAALAGRTDPQADNGGENRLIALPDLARLIPRGTRPGGGSSIYGLRRDVAPLDAPGSAFLVYGVFGETFEE